MFKDFKFSDWTILGFIALFAIFGLLHIAFGLRNVLEVLSSTTAAAWLQAIGAIAAIGIAIWVANRSERLSERNAEIASNHFLEMAEAAIGGLYVASSNPGDESSVQKTRFIGELKEVQLIGHGIQLGQLPQDLCKDVLTVRTTVGRCVYLGTEIGKYDQKFDDLEEGLRSHPRDGYTIAYALLKASWESIKELNEKRKKG